MKKPTTLIRIALLALAAATALTLVFGAALWDVAGNRAFQALGGWLRTPMVIFTFLGDEQFYLLVIPLVYWCLHKGLGADLGVLLVLSSFTNTALKSFFKHSRPFWEAPALRLSDATSFSTPSGHAQSSAALFGYGAWFGADKRRGRLWATLLALLIVMVALSRVYLGVHFTGDILWGAAVGLGLAAAYAWLKPRLLPRLVRLLPGRARASGAGRLGRHDGGHRAAAGDPLRLGPDVRCALFRGVELGAGGCGHDRGAGVRPLGRAGVENRAVRFSVAGPPWQRAVRYLLGVIGLAAIWLGLRIIFPQEPLLLGLALRTVRYTLAMLWAIALWPWLFVKIGLGTREPV